MDETELKAKLPPAVTQRLQSLRLANGSATLVLDAGGLDRAEGAALEAYFAPRAGESGGPVTYVYRLAPRSAR